VRRMKQLNRALKTIGLLAVFGVGSHFALEYGTGGLWKGLRAAHAVVGGAAKPHYDLSELRAVNATLDMIRKKYVEPGRVDPRQMFLGALDRIQMDIPPVIVTHGEKSPTVKVQVFDQSREFRVDNVQGPWDVAARLREVFTFIQPYLERTNIELPEVEYAASNGMLHTLDPHSTFLSPDAYQAMKVSTSGHFGGLGIVISMRDQKLTVMRPIPGTPAGRAGVKRLDRIVKINSEATLNMPVDDAVERLRGDPGSKVTIWLEREGAWQGSRPFELVREDIHVASVEHHKLDGGIGYVRLKQFQEETATELKRALTSLARDNSLNALVLDLRDNPGGLLDQAARVADLFLESGTIYATVGHSEGRHEQPAVRPGTEPNYPVVVLVNGSSASASEIVSGALKNQNRAVIVGETTFGKGSVQLVFPDITPEGAALKLTIAQYLTPGDISIQGTGVTPDIALEAMTADALEMNLIRDDDHYRERDLSRTLGAGGRRVQEPPEHVLRFNLPEAVRQEIRERGSQMDDEFTLDGPIRLARELAVNLRPGPRKSQVEALRAVLGDLEKREVESVAADLSKMGIDWSMPKVGSRGATKAEQVEAQVRTLSPGDAVTAGEPMELEVTVHNHGPDPVYRLYAVSKSDNAYYDERELIFGKLEPGKSLTRKVPFGFCTVEGQRAGSSKPPSGSGARKCKMPLGADERADGVRVELAAEGLVFPEAKLVRPTIRALPQPEFAFGYQVLDNRQANQNGQLERGEGASLFVRFKNIGEGRSYETQANLRNLTGQGVLLGAGRFDMSNMQPGEEREVTFTFDVLPLLEDPEVRLQLSIVDSDLGVFAGEKLKLPVLNKPDLHKLSGEKGVGVARAQAALFEGPEGSRSFGTLKEGAVVETLGQVGGRVLVRLGPERVAFVASPSLRPGSGVIAEKAPFESALTQSSPRLSAKAGELATRGETVRVEASAEDGLGGIEDVVVFVGNRKVFYKPNLGADRSRIHLATDVPLHGGVNIITVVARENEDTMSRRTLVVRKDGPNGEILPTPRNQTFGEGWEFEE
jgi:carboxyl-terminal processing protease